MPDHGAPRDLLATRLAQVSARLERFAARQIEMEMQQRDLHGKLNQLADEIATVRHDQNRRLEALERSADRDPDR